MLTKQRERGLDMSEIVIENVCKSFASRTAQYMH